jgi:hypothetical protein
MYLNKHSYTEFIIANNFYSNNKHWVEKIFTINNEIQLITSQWPQHAGGAWLPDRAWYVSYAVT